MIALDLMTRDPVTIVDTAKVRDAIELLQTLDVRHLPVVDADGELVGMLSDRDLRGLAFPHLIDEQYSGILQTGLLAAVATIMSTGVLSVEPDADVALIVELMLDHKVGALPVVDSREGLVGIVSYMDVLREAVA